MRGSPVKICDKIPKYLYDAQSLPLPQVSGVQPMVSQAEVMQKELESCKRREYTPESLPLLLHQVTRGWAQGGGRPAPGGGFWDGGLSNHSN